jgi:hypothetical protein
MEGSVRVTGTTITVEQINEVRRALTRSTSFYTVCDIATGSHPPLPKAKRKALRSVEAARAACARAWNARNEGASS